MSELDIAWDEFVHHERCLSEAPQTEAEMRRPIVSHQRQHQQQQIARHEDGESQLHYYETWFDGRHHYHTGAVPLQEHDYHTPSSDGYQGLTPGTERDGMTQDMMDIEGGHDLQQISLLVGSDHVVPDLDYYSMPPQGTQQQLLQFVHATQWQESPLTQPTFHPQMQWQAQGSLPEQEAWQGQGPSQETMPWQLHAMEARQQQRHQWSAQARSQWQTPSYGQYQERGLQSLPAAIYGPMAPQTTQWPSTQRAQGQVSQSQLIRPIAVKQETRSPPQRPLKPAGQLPTRPKNGIRTRGLSPERKLQASQMRKHGSCWRCVFQKDPCRVKAGSQECERCSKVKQAGKLYIHSLPCNNTKLPILVFDFLPDSMTMIHRKNNIEDTVKAEVVRWKGSLTISLTAGFGPELCWDTYEFEPRSQDLLLQYQFYHNEQTRQIERRDKWSPPLGIKELGRDEHAFEAYLQEILGSREHLLDFAEICYMAESAYDTFQQDLLTSICHLYLDTQDNDLREIMQKILRTLILTHIMGHTLTFVDDEGICAQYDRPVQEHTSPKLANRQLKFYFAVLREEICKELLRYGQNALRANKDVTWLPMFLVMIGFGMMLEEIQGVVAIQAVSKSSKSGKDQKSWDDAQKEAMTAYERIDAKYALLVALFQHKYRSDRWTVGSFGQGCPVIDGRAGEFCRDLRRRVELKEEHLRRRMTVPLGHEQQCNYTTRLVAKFLVPFLDLPK